MDQMLMNAARAIVVARTPSPVKVEGRGGWWGVVGADGEWSRCSKRRGRVGLVAAQCVAMHEQILAAEGRPGFWKEVDAEANRLALRPAH
jgi:hypothetical protein